MAVSEHTWYICLPASVCLGDSDAVPHSSSAHPLLHCPAVLVAAVSIPPQEKNVPGSPDAHPRLQAEAQVSLPCVQLAPGQGLPGGVSPRTPISAACNSCVPRLQPKGAGWLGTLLGHQRCPQPPHPAEEHLNRRQTFLEPMGAVRVLGMGQGSS